MEYVTWIRNTAIPFLSPNIGISWPHGMGLMGYPHFSSFASCWIIATRGGKLIRNDLFIYHWLFLTWLYRKWLKWSFIDDLSIIIEDGDFPLNIIKLRNDQKMPSFPLQNPSPQQECQIQAPRQLNWSSPHSARDATAFHHRFVEIHHEQCHAPYKKTTRISIERVLIQNMFKHMGFPQPLWSLPKDTVCQELDLTFHRAKRDFVWIKWFDLSPKCGCEHFNEQHPQNYEMWPRHDMCRVWVIF